MEKMLDDEYWKGDDFEIETFFKREKKLNSVIFYLFSIDYTMYIYFFLFIFLFLLSTRLFISWSEFLGTC